MGLQVFKKRQEFSGAAFVDVFKHQAASERIQTLRQPAPHIGAVLQPLLEQVGIALPIITGMTHHGFGAEQRRRFEQLLEAVARYNTNLRIYGTGRQVAERAMERDRQSTVFDACGHLAEFGRRETVQCSGIDADFRIQAAG
jgi:hypothetical protein